RCHVVRPRASLARGSRGDEPVHHTDERPIQLRREEREELLAQVQPERGLAARLFGGCRLEPRELASLAKAHGDLDDEDSLGEKGDEGEDVVRQEPEAGRWKKE